MSRYIGARDRGTTSTRFQAEVLGIPVNRARDRQWQPAMDPTRRTAEYALGKKAVPKTLDWVE